MRREEPLFLLQLFYYPFFSYVPNRMAGGRELGENGARKRKPAGKRREN
jgi:hypothetical protein